MDNYCKRNKVKKISKYINYELAFEEKTDKKINAHGECYCTRESQTGDPDEFDLTFELWRGVAEEIFSSYFLK